MLLRHENYIQLIYDRNSNLVLNTLPHLIGRANLVLPPSVFTGALTILAQVFLFSTGFSVPTT